MTHIEQETLSIFCEHFMRLIRPNFHDVINRAKVLGYILHAALQIHMHTYDIPPFEFFPGKFTKTQNTKNAIYIHVTIIITI